MSTSVAEEPKIVRIRQGLLVICPECGERCLAGSSQPTFTRYYCSNDDCAYSTKVTKPTIERRD